MGILSKCVIFEYCAFEIVDACIKFKNGIHNTLPGIPCEIFYPSKNLFPIYRLAQHTF